MISDYDFAEIIAEDSTTVTYRIIRRDDQKKFTLKTLRTRYPSLPEIARLEHEYAITRAISHPGLLHSYGLLKHQNALALLQEDFAAVTLRQALKSSPLPLETLFSITIQLLPALEVLHRQNIIHKAIQPANIWLNPVTGQVKLTNFGLASQIAYESQPLRTPQRLEGNLAYISPEQTGRMNRLIDHRTDFYSLGVTLYEALTGSLPFDVADPLELIHCHIARRPLPPHQVAPTIPPMLSALVVKLLAKTPEDRYSSAYGIRADLQRCWQAWTSQQPLADFALGQEDRPFKFQIPQKLYGRATEVSALLAAVDQLGQGSPSLTLLYGYSGVGKTTLVNEVYKPITQMQGRFVTGKFDQFKRNLPYSAFIQAFRDGIRQILTEPEEQIALWQTQILATLGSLGQVLIEVIPEVELVIGKQPPAPELPPTESQNRFNSTLQRFVDVLASAAHPLVIFLDDLQWADAASLHLLQLLVTQIENQHVLIIGAYREQEVTPDHPLLAVLAALEKNHARIMRIPLAPLPADAIGELLADTLQHTPDQVAALTALLVEKTGGNPFFVREFLTTLYQEKLLHFDTLQHSWQWDLDKIQQSSITDNVAELVVSKLQKLAPATQQALQLAACLGNRFDLKTLATICQCPQLTVMSRLSEAMQEVFILPLDDAYKLFAVNHGQEGGVRLQDVEQVPVRFEFSHDQVQQAAYSLISTAESAATHLQIGRLLLQHSDPGTLEEELFAVVNHLNLGRALAPSGDERLQLAQLNLRAGKKAKAATAYEPALRYFTTGSELLGTASWQTHYAITLELYRERAECEFLVKNYEQAEKLFDLVLAQAQTIADKVAVYTTRVNLPAHQGDHEAALALGLAGLQLLGVRLSANPGIPTLVRELLAARWYLGRKNPEDLLHLPQNLTPQNQAIMQLLINLWGDSFWLNRQSLYGAIVLRMFQQSLRFGNSKFSPIAYVCYGALLTLLFKNYRDGAKFGELALQLADHFGDMTTKSRVIFIYAAFLNHLRAPHTSTVELFQNALRYSQETGDLVYAAYCSDGIITTMPLAGHSLAEIGREAQVRLAFAQRVNALSVDNVQCVRKWVAALAEEPGPAANPGHQSEPPTPATEKKPLGLDSLFQLQVAYLFAEYDQALALAARLQGDPILSGGQYVPFYEFYRGLTLAARYPAATGKEQRQYLRLLKQSQKKMETWAASCPANYGHKALLLQAELARLNNQGQQAGDLYEQAIAAARQHGLIQEEAVANELAAKFYLAQGKPKIARLYLQDARYGYLKWGATRKVKQIDAQVLVLSPLTAGLAAADPLLSTTTPTVADLDLASVLQASQAIAGEIELEKLLATLLKVVLENAGAQTAILLLHDKKSWLIEAEGTVIKSAPALEDQIEVTALHATPLEEAKHKLSLAIVNYVARTRENVVLNHATQEGLFLRDPYIVQNQSKSILCAPLINQGKLTAILYLENNLTTGAFTPDRLEVLNLLSAQAAISIENARLYSHQVALTNGYSRFVPLDILRFLQKESIVDVQLGDQVQQESAILVSDIRGFTTLSETMSAQENFDFVNAYLSRIGPVIRQHNGLIVKYMGDGIMAIFPQRPEDALHAALEKQRQVARYNEQRQAHSRLPLRVGIGIHIGQMMLGTIGEAERMQSDLLSDVVNLTTRLEGLTRDYGASIIISQEYLDRLPNPAAYQLRFLGKTTVKGRQGLVTIYEVFDVDPPDQVECKRRTRADFEAALQLFYQQRWREAAALFAQIVQQNPHDQAATFYWQQADRYLHPVPARDQIAITV